MIVPLRPFRNAVNRNYGRRRIREFYRLNKLLFPENCDLLVRLFRAPDDWDVFFHHLEELLERARSDMKSIKSDHDLPGGPAHSSEVQQGPQPG